MYVCVCVGDPHQHICDVTSQNQTNVVKQVCDLSFHMKFYLRNYANRIKSYIYRDKVLCLIFAKSLN